MSRELICAAKRIALTMAKLGKDNNNPQLLGYFMGLGTALGFLYEVSTGRSIPKEKIKPAEILKWANELKEEPTNIVTL